MKLRSDSNSHTATHQPTPKEENKTIDLRHYVVVNCTYPKNPTPSYDYNEWDLKSIGFEKKRDAVREGIRVRDHDELFMNWNGDDFDCKVEDDEDWPESDIDDEDIKCDEWHTYEIGSPNYADDEGRSIHVMLYRAFLRKKDSYKA